MPPIDTINWIIERGLSVALLIALWGVLAGRWRTSRNFDEMQKDLRDQLVKAEERYETMFAKAEERYQAMKAERDAMRGERDQWVAHTLRLTKITGAAVEKMAGSTKVEES